MNYRALARKYRSQHFGQLIGQEALVRTLSNAIEKNRIHHAYLFTGIRGTGKTSTARILAKAINYVGPDGKAGPTTGPTDDCAICQAIMAGQQPDVIEIDAASNTGIDDVRQIIENSRYAPMQARYKVFIIDEVHMLSKAAFNALLKTLEEPPPHVVFMLATTEIRKVPVTILSRCQRFDLRRIPADLLAKHYKEIAGAENVPIDDEALQLIAHAADGSARDGLSLLDQAIAQANGDMITAPLLRDMLGQADRQGVIRMMGAVLKGDAAGALDELAQQYQSGGEPQAILDDLLEFVHLITRIKVTPALAGDKLLSPAWRDGAMTLAGSMDLPGMTRLWQMLLRAVNEVAQAPQPMQALEMVLIRVAYAATLPPLDDLLKRGLSGAPATNNAAPAAPAPTKNTEPVMRVVSSQQTAAAVKQAPQPMSVAPPAPQADAVPQVAIGDYRALVALCEERNDIMLAADLHSNVRLVRMQAGQLEIAILPGADKDLVSRLTKSLQAWTGQRWIIAVASSGGQLTLREQAIEAKNQIIKQAQSDSALKPWFGAFPDLKITDVKE